MCDMDLLCCCVASRTVFSSSWKLSRSFVYAFIRLAAWPTSSQAPELDVECLFVINSEERAVLAARFATKLGDSDASSARSLGVGACMAVGAQPRVSCI